MSKNLSIYSSSVVVRKSSYVARASGALRHSKNVVRRTAGTDGYYGSEEPDTVENVNANGDDASAHEVRGEDPLDK